jgi:hypothetical protein
VARFGRLCIPLVLVCGSGFAAGPSAADLAKAIRAAGLDPDECYRVRDLDFQQEDIKLYLTEGYLIFAKPVQGESRAAIFTAAVQGGDGEVILLPPNRGERESLALFTNSANLDEHFSAALMIFSGGAHALLDRLRGEGSAKKAADVGAALAEKWNPVLDSIRSELEMRMLSDLMGPAQTSGMLFVAFEGRQLGSFDVVYDPLSREQIEAGQLTERNGRPIYNVWTSFASRSARNGASRPARPWFSMSDFRIDAALDNDLNMQATTRARITVGPRPLRGFPFYISHAMRVTSVKIDGAPAELFADPSIRGQARRGDDNDILLAVAPQVLDPGSVHEFEFAHQGAVITPAGNNVFFVAARASWYPRYLENWATYDLTFHYPKRWTLVTAGDQMSDSTDGDTRVTRWRTPVPIRMAGFNLGDYEKVTGAAPGFTVEVYGNKTVESALMPKPPPSPPVVMPFPPPKTRILAQPDAAPPMIPPNPRARLREVADQVSSSFEFFASKFGPPALKTLTISPIPGAFGQGFPGLVYLSTLSYLDPSQRPAALRGESHQIFFSELIAAHEVAHQWWGNVITADGYQDDWLLEALANYSALLWLEHSKGDKALDSVLDLYREHLLAKSSDGRPVESAGPIIWGGRLDSTGIDGARQVITYEKGAWILHMVRVRLGEERFLAMLAEMRRRFEFHSISTDDFRALVKEFVPARTRPDWVDNFFDTWIDSTGIPALKVKYSIKGAPPAVKISGTLTQSGVEDDFSADVPVEIQFARGAAQTVWVRSSSDPVTFSATVRHTPVRVSLGSGILAKR